PGDGSGVGVGSFHQTGGSSTLSALSIKCGSSAEVGGGNAFVNTDITIGSDGNGTLVHSGGQTEVSGGVIVGTAGGAGTLNVRGGTLTATHTEIGSLSAAS